MVMVDMRPTSSQLCLWLRNRRIRQTNFASTSGQVVCITNPICRGLGSGTLKDMDALYALLFLVVFIVHEFEEIIFVKAWVAKHRTLPRFGNQLWVKNFSKHPLSTATFAVLVAEEFVLIGGLVFAASLLNAPAMFAGLVIAYGLHLLGHIVDMIVRRAYVPGGPTAFITLPAVAWLAYTVIDQTQPSAIAVILWTLGLGAFLILNLRCLYIIAPRIERFLHR